MAARYFWYPERGAEGDRSNQIEFVFTNDFPINCANLTDVNSAPILVRVLPLIHDRSVCLPIHTRLRQTTTALRPFGIVNTC